jgi:hypothetical protein
MRIIWRKFRKSFERVQRKPAKKRKKIILILGYFIYKQRRLFKPVLLTLTPPILTLGSWMSYLKAQLGETLESLEWVLKPTLVDLVASFRSFFFNSQLSLFWTFLLVLGIVFGTLYLFSNNSDSKNEKAYEAMVYLLLLSLFPIIGVFLASRNMEVSIYLDRTLLGFLAVFLTLTVYLFNKVHRYLVLVFIAFYFVLGAGIQINKSFEAKGFKELADFARYSNKTLVFTNAYEYTITKHYLAENVWKNIKLQDNLIEVSDWPLISSEEILVKEESDRPFYLVNKGPLKGWDFDQRVESFYLYEWQN